MPKSIHSVKKTPSVTDTLISTLKRGPKSASQLTQVTGLKQQTILKYLNGKTDIFVRIKEHEGSSPAIYDLMKT